MLSYLNYLMYLVQDMLGILGPILDSFWATIGTFISSGTLWLFARYNETIRNSSEPVKWVSLYIFSLVWNVFATLVGAETVDPMTFVWGAGAFQNAGMMGAAALIYKLSGHQVPKTA